mmetsp:Transcript_10694/g.13523  ORF Transcript_10694/g.13523 Transcript_10694/m.13523 type:complete len:227 (+) Transcript_10694:50-730(+)
MISLGLPKLCLFTCIICILLSITKANFVTKLTDDSFEHLTQAATGQTTGKWFINFHSPNCGHCQTLEPIWESFAEEIVKEHHDSGVLIGSVDVTKTPQTSQRFGIMHLPTLIYFANGGMYTYSPENGREVDDFVKFVLGEFKDTKMEKVPDGPSGLLKLVTDLRKKVYDIEPLRALLDDVEHIFLFRKNAVLIVLVFGSMIGFFIGALVGMSKGLSKKNKSKSKKD